MNRPTGALQRLTLLDTLQEGFSFESQGLRPCIPEAENFI